MKHIFLADCNNFYVSCERLFNPALEGKPVVVLSSNDGCIIARSEEAKKLGLAMGEPFFAVEKKCAVLGIHVLSSNFALYADLSARVMQTLKNCAESIEIYSIDEAFFTLPDSLSAQDLIREGLRIKKQVRRFVGIPISIGIGPSKTLAKVANQVAKRKPLPTGLLSLMNPKVRSEVLQAFPIEDVWGLGSKLSQRLRALRIFFAGDLLCASPEIIRKKLGVLGEKTLWELRGVSTFELESPSPKKSLCVSRSFARATSEFNALRAALSFFACRACVKLREQKSYTSTLCVFVLSVKYENGLYRKYPTSQVVSLEAPTQDTSEILKAAHQCLWSLYQKGETYKKCGIVLLDLTLERNFIPDFFASQRQEKRSHLMSCIDAMNKRWGKDTLTFASAKLPLPCQPKAERLSSYSTTDKDKLPLVTAKKAL